MNATLLRWAFSRPAAMWYCLAASSLHASLRTPSAVANVAEQIALLLFASALGQWATADARQRGLTLPLDFGLYTLFAWAIVLPAYLFRTRGWRGLVTIAWFALLYVGAALVGAIAFWLR